MTRILERFRGYAGAVRPGVLIAGGVSASAVAVVIALSGGGGGGFTCNATLSGGGNITSTLSSLPSGQTLCLNAGTYSYTAGAITKSSQTTVRPANGVAESAVTLGDANLRDSAYLTFRDLTINGQIVIGFAGTAPATNVQILSSAFTSTGAVCVRQPRATNSSTDLIDGNTFTNSVVMACGNEGRISIVGDNIDDGVLGYDSGIVISNNVLDGPSSGTTAGVDGIQIVGGPTGVTIRDNEIKNLNESACGTTHCDPFQFVGGDYTTFDGNYLHNNSSGFVDNDCAGDHAKITNNVFVNSEIPDNLMRITSQNDIFDHNVVIGAPLTIGLGSSSTGCGASGRAVAVTITNNYASAGLSVHTGTSWSRTGTLDHNMGSMGGTNQIAGSPTFVGGATPSTWLGYELASSSNGYHAAADGSSIGIVP